MSKTTVVLCGIIAALALSLAFVLGRNQSLDFDQTETLVNKASTEFAVPYSVTDEPVTERLNTTMPEGAAKQSGINALTEGAFSASEKQLIASTSDAWSDYRNGNEPAYDRHTAALDQLLRRNICWGKVDEPQAAYEYHRCVTKSIQKQPEPDPNNDEAKCTAGDHAACLRL